MFSLKRRIAVLGTVLTLGLVLGVTGAAGAFSSPREAPGADSVSIQAVFDRAGNPLLVANVSPNGALATATWQICPPGGTCAAAPTSKDGVLEPGSEPAGTQFVASATYGGQTYSDSVTWQGQVTAVSAPTLSGQPQINHVLVPVAGTWSGGWPGDRDQLGVEACRSASGRDCKMLGGGELGCPDDSSRTHVGGWFTGWYVFALDARYAADSACAGTGYFGNASLPLWPLGATVTRSAELGVITGPPRPTVRFFPRAVVSGDRLKVVSLNCRTLCRVNLEVLGTTSGVSRHTSFTGRRTLTISRTALPAGRVSVSLYVDDSPLLRARSVLP